jgi:hypothetical protein
VIFILFERVFMVPLNPYFSLNISPRSKDVQTGDGGIEAHMVEVRMSQSNRWVVFALTYPNMPFPLYAILSPCVIIDLFNIKCYGLFVSAYRLYNMDCS